MKTKRSVEELIEAYMQSRSRTASPISITQATRTILTLCDRSDCLDENILRNRIAEVAIRHQYAVHFDHEKLKPSQI